MRDPRVLALANSAVAAAGSIAAVAITLGISRPYLSRYLNDDLDGVEPIEATIVKRYDRRLCPHTELEIAPDVCVRKALAPQPFGGNERLAYWITCQTCSNKPESQKS